MSVAARIEASTGLPFELDLTGLTDAPEVDGGAARKRETLPITRRGVCVDMRGVCGAAWIIDDVDETEALVGVTTMSAMPCRFGESKSMRLSGDGVEESSIAWDLTGDGQRSM